jgi:hypothetical protein
MQHIYIYMHCTDVYLSMICTCAHMHAHSVCLVSASDSVCFNVMCTHGRDLHLCMVLANSDLRTHAKGCPHVIE